jgi:hypothetical protein
MSKSSPARKDANESSTPPQRDWAAAFLSYLVPGLGQVYQGRVAKGVLYLVCIYTLFIWGMALGHWKNVFLPDPTRLPPVHLLPVGGRSFPILSGPLKGPMAAVAHRVQFLGQVWMGIAVWPAIWQYYHFDPSESGDRVLGDFQREPEERVLNQLQNEDDKRWDLGWVFTVIAGVLNIMVIYDAFAGPAFGTARNSSARESEVRHANVSPAGP